MDLTERDMSAPYRITLIPLEGFALMSYAAVAEPFRAANLMAGSELYRLTIAPPDGAPARASSGVIAPAEAAPGSTSCDLALVIAGGDPFAVRDRALFGWIRRLARAGVTLGGVSGGPVVLARAGVMAGRRMTVHWEHAERLAAEHPDLAVEQRLYLIDRDRVTCAGGAAPLDLCHALIAARQGPDFARAVSDWFLHTAVRPAQDPQRAGLAARLGVSRRAVLDAVEAMENHLADPLSLEQLAGFAGVGPRQLTRLFSQELGLSAMAWYRRLRLDAAHRLLSATTMPLTDVALATGFASSAHFSRAFSAAFKAAPSSVRRKSA